MQRVLGFVGLGNVGSPMALNLLKSGFNVVGFDVKQNLSFLGAGGRVAASCDEVAAAAPVVIHSLPNEAAIATSVNAILKAPLTGRVLIEMSSFGLDAKLAQAERLRTIGRRHARLRSQRLAGSGRWTKSENCGPPWPSAARGRFAEVPHASVG
jgi:3-hydroxyisobutyrate dehydrogenase-like beta-hydroxyacid dehydrogenase